MPGRSLPWASSCPLPAHLASFQISRSQSHQVPPEPGQPFHINATITMKSLGPASGPGAERCCVCTPLGTHPFQPQRGSFLWPQFPAVHQDRKTLNGNSK